MPQVYPSYDDLYERAKEDLKGKLGITSVLGRLVLIPLAKVLAGAQKIMYATIIRANNNILPDLADDETLLRHGKIRLQRVPNEGAQGQYLCDITGVTGGTIPADTTYTSVDGFVYVIDSQFTLTGSTGQITLRAFDYGLIATRTVDDVLSLTKFIANVDSNAIVNSTTVEPTKPESIEEYRVNVLQSYARQPQGGARGDYRKWTESVPGVREVYPYVRQGAPTEVALFIEAFPDNSIDGYGTPSQATMDAVLAAIEPINEPMGVAEIHYSAIQVIPVDVDILGLNDVSLLPSIVLALIDKYYNIRPYIAGDDPLTDQFKGVIRVSDVLDAVKSVTNDFTDVAMTVNSNLVSSYEFINNEIPYSRNVTNS